MKRYMFILISLLFLAADCSKKESNSCHKRIHIENTANTGIYVLSDNDTILKRYGTVPLYPRNYVRENTLNSDVLFTKYCIENTGDSMFVFIFSKDTINNNEWGTVCENYMVLQRYDMNLKDLQNLDWQISYPPSKKMKNIKMYPAYAE